MVAFLESFLDVAPLDLAIDIHVSFAAFVDFRHAFLHRIQGVERRGKDFVFDIDQAQSFLGNVLLGCRDNVATASPT